MTEQILKEINHDLTKENDLLLMCVLVLMIAFIIWFGVALKEKNDLKKENTKLEQQVIDYKWQLEQVQYIMEYQKGE